MKKIKNSVLLKGNEIPGKLKFKVVNSSDLGNCWSPSRFCGGRCAHVVECKLPERNTCKAVDAEKKYLNQFYLESHTKLNELQKSSLGKLRKKN